MKSTLILGATLAASTALAGPLNLPRQEEVTDWVFETVYVTVTGELAATMSDTPAPTDQGEVQKAAATTTSETPQPTTSDSPPPAPPASTQSSTTQSSSSSGLGQYQQSILDAHNSHRANHSVSDIKWSYELAGIADKIASSCVYGHETKTGGGGYGQNIGAGTIPSDINKMITNAMYNNEIGYYPGYGNEPDMGDFHRWGHFSQIVWKDTQEVGCATVHCPGGLANTGSGIMPYFTVCNYKPVGNMAGEYGANVLQPKGMATVQL